MSIVTRALRSLGVAAAAVSLSACISLLPEDKPAKLYRFDGAPAAEPSPAAERFGVVRAGGGFVQAAANDRILTVNGSQASYIAESRWVSPAQVLFGEALTRAFDANTGGARLLGRGELGKADYSLRVEVTRFEAVYDQGAKAAPNVVVAVRTTLVNSDRTLAGTKQIETQVRARDNRVGAIVGAFDEAVGQTLGELVAWTNARGAG
jgi:cholesterol transport system auxiliary component